MQRAFPHKLLRRWRALLCTILLGPLAAACSPGSEPPPGGSIEEPEAVRDPAMTQARPDTGVPSFDPSAGTLVEEIEDLGDTVVVRALSGSVWPGPAVLVEEVRIGALEGPEEVTFGQISEMAPDGAGGVYVFDPQVPVIRHFDAEGRFLGNVGREGSGPGEYRDHLLGMALRRNGGLMIRDPENARLTVYDPDGTPTDHWPFGSGLYTSDALLLDTADHAYLKILTGPTEPNTPWPYALAHLDAQGNLIDTIPYPTVDNVPESGNGMFFPRLVWGWSPLGYPVVGVNDRYSFDLRVPDGPVIRVERRVDPVRLHEEERAEFEAMRARVNRTRDQTGLPEQDATPEVKSAYEAFHFTRSGQIWVRIHVEAEKREVPEEDLPEGVPPRPTWIEPPVYDVFQPDGRYLGQARVDQPRTDVWVFDEGTPWGLRAGEFGEAYLVRFRLAFPENVGKENP